MKVADIIQENYIHNVTFDWPTLQRNMAAKEFQEAEGQGTNYADAIVYLGLLGDPKSSISVYNIPAVIGAYNRDAEIRAGRADQGPWANDPESKEIGRGIHGEYGSWDVAPDGYQKDWPMAGSFVDKKNYQILVRVQDGDDLNKLARANPRVLGDLAHELRHRGFDIIRSTPSLYAQMPAQVHRVGGFGGHETDPSSPYYIKWSDENRDANGPRHDGYLEHAMMYSIQFDTSSVHEKSMYKDMAQRKLYQKLYKECEAAARRYLDTVSVPKSWWKKLAAKVDQVTPNTVKPVVVNKSDGSTTIDLKIQPKLDIGQQSGSAVIDPRDGVVGQELARLGISRQQRLDQNYIDKTLGPGYQAGSKSSNLALLSKARSSQKK